MSFWYEITPRTIAKGFLLTPPVDITAGSENLLAGIYTAARATSPQKSNRSKVIFRPRFSSARTGFGGEIRRGLNAGMRIKVPREQGK
ncbi:MAG: hypothetical protein RH946_17685 [Rhodospirillales bacterium]